MAVEASGMVVDNRKIQSVYYTLEIQCPPVADVVLPGQFVMLRVARNGSPLLRRPFSVYRAYPVRSPKVAQRGSLLIIYKLVGKGTQKMVDFTKGERVDLIGPLGNGFHLPPLPFSGSLVLIGGGVGIVSLYSLAEAVRAGRLMVFVGGRTRQDILCTRDFLKMTPHVFVATEDGSRGFKGTVIDLFRSEKGRFKGKEIFVYSCGPMNMLKELSETLDPNRFSCQVSLEARMACGFGACYGCAVKTKDPQTPYHRVCKEGPVFDLHELLWE
jgi:dihydroorotate dehydrogenase electron transfer subunit